MRNTFNMFVLNSSSVVHQTIAGVSSCDICVTLSVLGMDPNDSLVPYNSVNLFALSGEHTPIGEFDARHNELPHNSSVIRRAYCRLAGREPDVNYCADDLDESSPDIATGATPATDSEGSLAYFDTLQIPAGDADNAELPIGGLGPVDVAVFVDQAGLTATLGNVSMESESTDDGAVLTGHVDSPVDLELAVSSAGSEDATGLVIVAGTGVTPLDIAVPRVAGPGDPLTVRVTGTDSLAGLTASVTAPSGARTQLALAGDGPDAVATFTPNESGEHMVTATQTGRLRRPAFGIFAVASGGATLPGSFTESLATGTGELATAIQLDVDVDVDDPGAYRLVGRLTAGDGTDLATAEVSGELAAGRQELRLSIPGAVLYGTGVDGPYQIHLALLRPATAGGGEALEAAVSPATPTQPYEAGDFQPAAITAGHSRSSRETSIRPSPRCR